MNYTTDPRLDETRYEESTLDRENEDKTPGVYVRSHDIAPSHELDLLWSGNRAQHLRDERSPVITFVFGLVVGVLLTSAVAFFFFIKPEIKTGDAMTTPVTEAASTQPQVNQGVTPLEIPTTPKSEEAVTTETGSTGVGTSEPHKSSESASTVGETKYTVKNGDTLESIARHHYGSGKPDYIEKIRRANNIKNINALKLDQELVIPPKSY